MRSGGTKHANVQSGVGQNLLSGLDSSACLSNAVSYRGIFSGVASSKPCTSSYESSSEHCKLSAGKTRDGIGCLEMADLSGLPCDRLHGINLAS